jgi:hypothetical protein
MSSKHKLGVKELLGLVNMVQFDPINRLILSSVLSLSDANWICNLEIPCIDNKPIYPIDELQADKSHSWFSN